MEEIKSETEINLETEIQSNNINRLVKNEKRPFSDQINNVNDYFIQQKLMFKVLIDIFIEHHKKREFEFRINTVLLIIAINSPFLLLDKYFIDDINSYEINIYLLISFYQRLFCALLSFVYITCNNLDKIQNQLKNKKSYPFYACYIDRYWCEYYSSIGIVLVVNSYLLYGYINSSYLYILLLSVFKLCMLVTTLKNYNLLD
jgi:hypothetical protein